MEHQVTEELFRRLCRANADYTEVLKYLEKGEFMHPVWPVVSLNSESSVYFIDSFKVVDMLYGAHYPENESFYPKTRAHIVKADFYGTEFEQTEFMKLYGMLRNNVSYGFSTGSIERTNYLERMVRLLAEMESEKTLISMDPTAFCVCDTSALLDIYASFLYSGLSDDYEPEEQVEGDDEYYGYSEEDEEDLRIEAYWN